QPRVVQSIPFLSFLSTLRRLSSFLYRSRNPQDLLAFPTRRSSDLTCTFVPGTKPKVSKRLATTSCRALSPSVVRLTFRMMAICFAFKSDKRTVKFLNYFVQYTNK